MRRHLPLWVRLLIILMMGYIFLFTLGYIEITHKDFQKLETDYYLQQDIYEAQLAEKEAAKYPGTPLYIGEFKITFYNLNVGCTGKTNLNPAYGITRSGAKVREGVTVAVDPNVIPLGTYIYIEGLGYYIAQDTGGAVKGNVIDVYVDDMQTGYDLGGMLKGVKVWSLQ